MYDFHEAIRRSQSDVERATRSSIDESSDRKIVPLDNGDRFVNNGCTGYVVDGVTGEVKGWRIVDGLFGGPAVWREAEFSRAGGSYALHKKPDPIFF